MRLSKLMKQTLELISIALAQLGRKQEAMRVLKSAHGSEFGATLFYFMQNEEDFKPLADLAEFKALLKKKDEK